MHECLKAIQDKWDGPFERPVTWSRPLCKRTAGRWAIKVYQLTKGGNISRKDSSYLWIKHCPLCGEKL